MITKITIYHPQIGDRYLKGGITAEVTGLSNSDGEVTVDWTYGYKDNALTQKSCSLEQWLRLAANSMRGGATFVPVISVTDRCPNGPHLRTICASWIFGKCPISCPHKGGDQELLRQSGEVTQTQTES